jgi:hypothetical protein
MLMKRRSFYTPRSLFRRIRPDLLRGYFKSHKTLQDFDWDSYAENKWRMLDDLADEFYKAPGKKRDEIDEELRRVNSLSGLAAQETLEAVARQFNLDWDEDMTPEDRALAALMENKNAFMIACHWSNLENYESFADFVAKKPREPLDWVRLKHPLTDAWKLLLQNQDKGYGRVFIEHYTATDRQAYLVYYEAPSQYITRFDDMTDQPEEKTDRPVLESLLIYYPKSGRLKVKAKTEVMAESVRDDYARIALGDEHCFAEGNERAYDMDKFKRKLEPADFPTDPADLIASVRAVMLRFQPDAATKDVIEVISLNNIRELIQALKIDLSGAVIKKVRLQVKFVGTRRNLVKSFNLSAPNKNTLGDSRKDRLLEQYLVKWGVANR